MAADPTVQQFLSEDTDLHQQAFKDHIQQVNEGFTGRIE